MRINSTAFSLLILSICNAQAAMHLSSDGHGQVLLYPYYAATDQVDTLVSIFNLTDQPKAARVRLIDAVHGFQVFQFNLYLGPNDVWVGALTAGEEAPILRSADASCTVPAFDEVLLREEINRSDRFVDSDGDDLADTALSHRPTMINATGYLEVIEMAKITNPELRNLFRHNVDGCPDLLSAWAPGGIWDNDVQFGVGLPTGGLAGSASLIDVQTGAEYGYKATAIDGFYTPASGTDNDQVTTLNSAPSSAHPNLTDANTAAETGDPAMVRTLVLHDGRATLSNWQVGLGDERTSDPVSAVLMASSLRNEIIKEFQLEGESNWVVTFPTLRYHARNSSAPEGAAVSLLTAPFDGGEGDRESAHYPLGFFIEGKHNSWDRRGIFNDGFRCTSLCPTAGSDFGFGTVQISLMGEDRADQSTLVGLPDVLFGTDLAFPFIPSLPFASLIFESGHAEIDFSSSTGSRQLHSMPDPETGEYHTYYGLPVIGFAAMRIVNGDLTGGDENRVRANYGRTAEHTYFRRIEASESADTVQ